MISPFTTLLSFSIMIFDATAIKTANIARFPLFIIHMIISTETCKVSYLVGSVDRYNIYFHLTSLPKYRKLLPLSHQTFINHAVKQKIMNNITVCLKYHKNKTKIDLHWNIMTKRLKLVLLKGFRKKYIVAKAFT